MLPPPLPERVLWYERMLLIHELQQDHPTRAAMAKALGISLRTLYYKLEQHGLGHMRAYEATHAYRKGWAGIL